MIEPETLTAYLDASHQQATLSSGEQTELIPDIEVLDERTAANLAALFAAFADPSRVRILSVLLEHEVSVGVIAQLVNMTESAVSHQMRGLRQLRLVRARKQGRAVYYALDDDHVSDIFRRGLEHAQHSR